jgi:uncharacterized protein (TIGR01777 family)
MKIAITGSHGLSGTRLVDALKADGHKTIRMVRKRLKENSNDVYWNPETRELDASLLEGFDAVIHLAGENIAARRWTEKQKEMIRKSRVGATKFLSEKLNGLRKPPSVFLSASAIGFYGHQGAEMIDETNESGEGFIADVCREWELAVHPARDAGIRTVQLRIGLVLSSAGGVLAKMLPPFRLGLGGKLGDGKQYMSWISIDDTIGAIIHLLEGETIQGPVNLVSPHPVSNTDFTKALSRVLRRPAIFPMPAFAARVAFGEMADELLLASIGAKPQRLSETGYRFHHPDLDGALQYLLER